MIIIITGLEIGWDSLIYLMDPPPAVSMAAISLVVSLIAIAVSYAVAVYKERVGKKLVQQLL